MQIINIKAQTQTTLIAGIISALAYVYLSINSQHYGQATLLQMLSTCFISTFACAAVWWHYHSTQQDIPISMLFGFAIIFRVIGLTAFPVLEDDIYRYLWDGRQTIVNGNPYIHPPANFFDIDNLSERFEHILDGINYPYVATVYGPTSQWLFAAAYIIAPGDIWPLQLILIIADLVIIYLLLAIAKPNSVLLYAWCPLVIKEFAFTAHPDLLGAFFMVCALRAYLNKQNVIVGILMALACGVKIFPIIIVPFLFKFDWRAWLSFVVTVIVIALPFGVQQAWLPEGLKVMSGDWFFNAPIYRAYGALTPSGYSPTTIKIVLVLTFGLVCALTLFKHLVQHYKHEQTKLIPRGDILFGLMLICLPALNPWYAIWLLPFAAIAPSFWAWAGASLLLLSYASGINLSNTDLGAYQIPNSILAIEFGLIAVAVFIHIIFCRSQTTKQTTKKTTK